MESKMGFQVTIKRSETVSAVLPLQEHWLPMSNLDLLLPPLDFGIFLCYPKNEKDDDENTVAVLKKSLAQALVTFYPFAGEIVQNRQGEPEILCNNRGVDFVHAYADVELKEIDLYRPDMSVQGKLVPVKVNGVLAVQATKLRCGGIVIGCTFDHRVADAHSANMFLTAWAETARSSPVTRVPSFRRSLLNPRRPLEPDHEQMDKIYAPFSSIAPPKPQDELVSQIYCVKASEIELLQSQASYNGTKRTKLESFAAFLWKTIAEGSDNEGSDKFVKLGVVVDGRSRLGSKLDYYFGNVLSVPYKESTVNNLRTTTLKSAAAAVHELISTAASSDHFLSLIDWVELRRPNPGVVRVYCKDPIQDEAAVVVSSGLRFPLKELDFGFGPPGLGSYHFPWGGETGYVMPVPSVKGNGDWVVYAHMSQRHLDLLEARAGHVFRPFAWEES